MGRRLTFLSNGDTEVSYAYDAAGQRISKTVNGVTTDFYYDDRGALILLSCEDGTGLYFYPEADGSIGSIGINGNRYYYVRNAQNDIIGITDKTGAFVARYTYDEWGVITSITDGNGNDVSSNPNHIANINPLRYRSYFYDTETGWYWLNTRYYNPEVGRFINADGALYYGIVYNLFSYCYNNPIMFCDCNGNCAHNSPGLGDCIDCLAGITPDEECTEYEIPTTFPDDISTVFDTLNTTVNAVGIGYIAVLEYYNLPVELQAGMSNNVARMARENSFKLKTYSVFSTVFQCLTDLVYIGAEAYSEYQMGVPLSTINLNVASGVTQSATGTIASIWVGNYVTAKVTAGASTFAATKGAIAGSVAGGLAGCIVACGVSLIFYGISQICID